MAGRSGSGKAGRDGSWISSGGVAGEHVPVRRRLLSAHLADEAQPLARDGADQLLFVAAVADRLSRGVDAAGQGRIRHDPAAPDRSDEIVLADDAVAILQQVDQQVEDLRLDGNGLRTAAQLAPIGIKRMAGKEKLHVVAPDRAVMASQRDNQANLKDKSSDRQSLQVRLSACCEG